MGLKHLARRSIYPALVRAGAGAYLRNKACHSTIIVTYHGVVHSNPGFSPAHIDATQFEQHLRYYRRHFDVIPLHDAISRSNGRHALAITFDDGYRNNLTVALPMLEQHEMPATFFVPGIIASDESTKVHHPDILRAIRCFHGDPYLFISHIGGQPMESTKQLENRIKHMGADEHQAFMAWVVKKYDLMTKLRRLHGDLWHLMTPEELRILDRSRLTTIGSHGHLHLDLGRISTEEAWRDLTDSRHAIEQALGHPVTMLAYPYGSYTLKVIEQAEAAGYTTQLGTRLHKADSRVRPRELMCATTTLEANILRLSWALNRRGF